MLISVNDCQFCYLIFQRGISESLFFVFSILRWFDFARVIYLFFSKFFFFFWVTIWDGILKPSFYELELMVKGRMSVRRDGKITALSAFRVHFGTEIYTMCTSTLHRLLRLWIPRAKVSTNGLCFIIFILNFMVFFFPHKVLFLFLFLFHVTAKTHPEIAWLRNINILKCNVLDKVSVLPSLRKINKSLNNWYSGI